MDDGVSSEEPKGFVRGDNDSEVEIEMEDIQIQKVEIPGVKIEEEQAKSENVMVTEYADLE